jgi:CMP-N-acetylneuraminic acid synthetase
MTSVFIPGRVKSERLGRKLLLPINNKGENLWELACAKLEALLTPKDRFALCCDKELVDIASEFNIEIINRSVESTQIDEPLTKVFGDIECIDDDKLMFLNPCMSRLKVKTIDCAIDWFDTTQQFTDITSVTSFNNWVYNCYGELITPLDYTSLSTKDLPTMYKAAHCFHMFTKSKFFEDGQMLHDKHGMFYIQPEECIDVDTLLDYKILRAMNGAPSY